MKRKKKSKIKFPRKPFRPRWDMAHTSDRDYNRHDFKKETQEIIRED